MRSGLGDHDVERLFDRYRGRVPPEADPVTSWFEKARAQVESGRTKRVGLVATNSIRGGANRRVLDQILIDFRREMSEPEASFFEAPFEYVREHVLPERSKNRRENYRTRWWRHVEP